MRTFEEWFARTYPEYRTEQTVTAIFVRNAARAAWTAAQENAPQEGEFARLRELALAATPGPWEYGHQGSEALWIGRSYTQLPVAEVRHDCVGAHDNSRANAAFIAACDPQTILALLSRQPSQGSVCVPIAVVNALKQIAEYSDHTGAERALRQVQKIAESAYKLSAAESAKGGNEHAD